MALTDKLSNIADAIRTKTETTGKMTLTEMPDKILGIQTSEDLDAELTEQQQLISELKTTLETKAAGGVTINNQDKTITENGTYTADEGYTGLGTVTVNVASSGSTNDRLSSLINRSITRVAADDFGGATQVYSYVFSNCAKLAEVILPTTITHIGQGSFQACSSLKSLTIPESVTEIGKEAFYYAGLESVTIPDSVKSIKEYAFRQCSATTLTIGTGMTSISYRSFQWMTKLQTVIFKGTMTSILATAFDYCTAITDAYVPWAEGAVANAPWGMTNATIHYNSEV